MNRIGLCLLFFSFCAPWLTLAQPSILILNAADKPLNSESVDLTTWAYFPNQLISNTNSLRPLGNTVSIESVFKEVSYGTFILYVKINPTLTKSALAVEVPALFSSYQLFANGNRIGAKGKVGASLQACVPETRPAVYFFRSDSDTIQFVLQVANFYPSPGGIKGALRLGSAQLLSKNADLNKTMDYALFIIILLIGIVSLCYYYILFEHRKVFLFLSFFSFSWLLRSLFGYHYRILDWVDLSWALLMRVEYLTMIFTTAFAMLFIASLFPSDFKKSIKTVALAISGLFAISVILLSPIQFIPQIRVYLGFSCLVLVYVFYVITKAFLDERGGSTMMLISMFMGSLAFGYAIISYFGLFEMNMMIYDISFMVLGLMLSFSVAVRISKIDRLSEAKVLTMEHFFAENRK